MKKQLEIALFVSKYSGDNDFEKRKRTVKLGVPYDGQSFDKNNMRLTIYTTDMNSMHTDSALESRMFNGNNYSVFRHDIMLDTIVDISKYLLGNDKLFQEKIDYLENVWNKRYKDNIFNKFFTE